jgi:hypothetical protein
VTEPSDQLIPLDQAVEPPWNLAKARRTLLRQRSELKEPGALAFKVGGRLVFKESDLLAHVERQHAAQREEVERRRRRWAEATT